MKIDELAKHNIPEKYIQKLREDGISELYPPQADVVRKGIFKERNLVVSLPTAGGKTLIATLSIIHTLVEKKGYKAVYIAPLIALASEKYQDFKRFFGKDYKVALSVGDLDSSDPWLKDYDIICVTTEKLDSLLRHNVEWVKRIGLVVADEIHMLNDSSRGPTLEILLTKLMKIVPDSQILGLSATISNSIELSKWLNATLVASDFRPVKLYEGVAFDSKIHFEEKEGYELDDSFDLENSIVHNTIDMNKQALIFTSTRRNAESLAERLSKTVYQKLKHGDKAELGKVANEIENVLENPTEQCKKLSKIIKSGIAFHHAGLMGKQKSLIEDHFRKGAIKAIVATPTLAMGVNLPAFRVLIRDVKRYYDGIGSEFIPVLEYKQFVGRSGRPQYDSYGESVLIAKSEGDAQSLVRHFIYGQPEEIKSKLALEPVLRMHALALIASGFCNSVESIFEFFNRTFYSHQYGDIELVKEKIGDILKQLLEWSFITEDKHSLQPSRIGKRISELYLDPLTAHQFLDALKIKDKREVIEFSYLQMISNSLEMRPMSNVRSSEVADTEQVVLHRNRHLMQEIPEVYDLEYEDFLKSIKTALMLESWINEAPEDYILSKFNTAPGELYNKLKIIDWLVYSVHELGLLSGYKDILQSLRKLRVRLKYGIKSELIPLVRLKGIGRVRGRRLYRSGLDSLEKLKNVPMEKLIQIVGIKVAQEIKNQMGVTEQNIQDGKQTTLD